MEVESGNRQSSSGPNRLILCLVAVVVIVIVGLIAVVLPLSFKTLEYYEYGFRKRETTGTVDTSKVYAGGLHLIGPDYNFKIFPASAHWVSFDKVTIFAADRLQVHITAKLQYFLRQDQLAQLHEYYDLRYTAILENNALDALKGAATRFFTRDFIHRRLAVEGHLFKVIRERLGGICCEKDCGNDTTSSNARCFKGCTPLERCQPRDSGLFVDVRYFQLHELDIPDELSKRFLQSLILGESTESEKLRQEALIIRKDTEALANRIENKAAEISQNATAMSSLERSRANANAQVLIEKARSDGLRYLYRELNLDSQDNKLAYDYLKTLRKTGNVNLAVDYNQYVSVGRAFT